jgi:streptogramin lyase
MTFKTIFNLCWLAVVWFHTPTFAQVTTKFSTGISPASSPADVVVGNDGNIWFTEFADTVSRIGRITPTGVVTEFYSELTPGSKPNVIIQGPDGNLWFTLGAAINRIGRITPSGVITEFAAGTNASERTLGITAGPDGHLWFTQPASNRIAKMTSTGTVTEYSSGISANADIRFIAAGNDGNLWFTEYATNTIARISTTGEVTEFTSGISSSPLWITAGPDGNMWFTLPLVNRIGKITPSGVVTEYSTKTTDVVNFVIQGPDGNLWFSHKGAGKVSRMTPTGDVTEFNINVGVSTGVGRLTFTPDGQMWFSAAQDNYIGRIVFTDTGQSTTSSSTTSTTLAFPFVGSYAGVFTGSETGTWVTTVSSSGAMSVLMGGGATGTGKINSTGEFSVTLTTGATVSGSIDTSTAKITGTWVNTRYQMSGTLSGSRSSTTVTQPVLTSMPLKAGWNLVGNSSQIEIPFTLTNSNIISVWKWVSEKSRWAFSTPALSGQALVDYVSSKGYDSFSSLKSGEGAWINVKTDMTLYSASLPQLSSSYFQDLPTGWSLISTGDNPTPAAFNASLSKLPPGVGSISNNLISLWAWDASSSRWLFYAPSLDANGSLSAYAASKGYMTFGSKTLSPNMGVWVNMP